MKKRKPMKYLESELRKDVITKRMITLNIGLREAAIEIGTSAATLSRIEHGKSIDIETFAKVVTWLDKEPNDYFEIIGKRQDGIQINKYVNRQSDN